MKFFIISLVIATLSGMGVGGGGLLVIYLTLFEGTEQLIAQAVNLCFFILCGLASTIYNVKKKKIVWKCTAILSISGAVTCVFGSIWASQINPDLLRKIFGGMLIIGGASSLISSFVKNKQKENI
ncbi:MAG: sulfite exporter TauE/SafE family protein [Clostridia bacterium]|nr:sulfite exporter TauE/SafE family protein [Clostridia bacterium]